jgi:hypothetical protein
MTTPRRIPLLVATLAGALTLAGCAPHWVRVDGRPATVDVDIYECNREAARTPTLGLGGWELLIRAGIAEQCMRARGYATARLAEEPR